jgi:hypothetical protein
MKKMRSNVSSVKKDLTWSQIDRILEIRGWFLVSRSANKRIYERLHERLVVFKTPIGKWKADYIVNNRLTDSSGVFEEDFVKLMTVEMGALR